MEVKTVHTLTRGFAFKQQMLPAAAVHCQVASSSEVMANADLPVVTRCSGGCPSSGHGNNLASSLRKVERMSVVWLASFFTPTIAHSVIHMYHPVPPEPFSLFLLPHTTKRASEPHCPQDNGYE